MQQGLCIRVDGKGPVQRLVDQRAVVGVPEDEGNDPPVIMVQDGTEVESMHTWTHIIFELRHVCQPLFVRLFRVELAVQHIVRQILRIWARRVQPCRAYLMVDRMPRLRQMRSARLSFTGAP